jgi:hypothetical protein
VLAPTELPERDESRRWLIESLWPVEGVGIIGGQAKSWKTWLALDLAVSVASRTPCIGVFPTCISGRVLVYAAEDSLPDVRARLAGICQNRAIPLESLNLGIIAVDQLHLNRSDDKARLEATLGTHNPVLLVLDPFVRLHSAIDENSAGDVSAILGDLRRLQRRHGVAIALVHHARKNGNGIRPGQALRGSSDFHAWGDVGLYLRRKEDAAILVVEHRSAASPKPLSVELNCGPEGNCPALRAITGPLETAPAEAREEEDDIRDRLLKLLAQASDPISQKKIRKEVQRRNKTVGEVLARLQAEGLVRHTPKGWAANPGQQLRLAM